METMTTMNTVTDKSLRLALITAATKLEGLLKEEKITLTTPIKTTTPFGLMITGQMRQNADDKPVLFNFQYSMNADIFKDWLTKNTHLTEGPLVFQCKGINICIPYGAEKYDKSAFCFDGPTEGQEVFLQLLLEPAVFHVHRDVFSGQEWECFYEKD